MSKNQLSTFYWRDPEYKQQYTPVTEKEAYELTKTVINLFGENGICYNVDKTMESKRKPKASLNRTATGFCLRVGVTRQTITTATIEPVEGRALDEKSFLRWN